MKLLKICSLFICFTLILQLNIINVYSEEYVPTNTEKSSLQSIDKPQYTVYVRNYNELVDAINNEKVTNIEFLQNISVNETITIDKDLVINGNNYSISSGSTNNIADKNNISYQPILKIQDKANVNIENTKIIGGESEDKAFWGIENNSSGVLSIVNSSIINCISENGGSAIYNKKGTVILKDCDISGNASKNNSSAILNNGKMVVDGCSVTENVCYSEDGNLASSIKSNKNSKLYLNNSTVAKNISTKGGSSITVDGGAFYCLNSNIIGNVSLDNDDVASGINFQNKSEGELLNNVIIGNVAGKSFKNIDVSAEKKCDIKSEYNCYTGENKILKDKTDRKLEKNIQNLVATEGITDFLNYSDINNIKIQLPMFVTLPNNTKVVGIKSDTAFIDGIKTVFDYDNLENIICGYIKKDKLILLSSKKASNINIVTGVQGGGKRPQNLSGSTLYDTLIDTSIASISVPKTDGGYVLNYNNFAKTVNKNEVLALTAVPYKGYKFVSWNIEDVKSDIIDSEITDQSITLSVKNNTKITPVFEKEDTTPVVSLFYNYKNSYSFSTDTNGNFKINEDMISVQDNKMLTGYNTKPDGTGETYLIGKNYTIKDNLVLYAMKTEYGYGYLAGTTEPNCEVELYGRDDYYLGYFNTGNNGDYVLNNIIPSYGEIFRIKDNNGNVLSLETIEISPVTEETELKISQPILKKEEKEETDEKIQDSKEQEQKDGVKKDEITEEKDNRKQVVEEEIKASDDTKKQEKEENKQKEIQAFYEKDELDIQTDEDEDTKQLQPETQQKPADNQDNNENVDELLELINELVRGNISPKYPSDVKNNEQKISEIKDLYSSLTNQEKDTIDEDYSNRINNFIIAFDKING